MTSPDFSTAPPKDKGLVAAKVALIRVLSAMVMPIATRVAKQHFGGETLDEAMAIAAKWRVDGYPATLGYWDSATCTKEQVARNYFEAIKRIATETPDAYLSIKPPALHYDHGLAKELAAAALAANVRLHCDSHACDAADKANAMADAMIGQAGSAILGVTLPGRWQRSLKDVDWAVERQLKVRVVKGQWPNPADANHDPRSGFLAVIDRLAGRVPHLAIATHDMPLAQTAIERAAKASTSLELEQILGLTRPAYLKWAAQNRVRFRLYIPFGKGYIPNAIGILRRNPRLIGKLLGM